MDNKFTLEIGSKLQYYVYALVNPRADPVFYVGKGAVNRVFQHIAEAENKNACSTSENLDQNRAIHATLDVDGKPLEVKYFIIRHGLTEEVAKTKLNLHSSIFLPIRSTLQKRMMNRHPCIRIWLVSTLL